MPHWSVIRDHMINKIEIKKTSTAGAVASERSVILDGDFTVDQMTDVVVKLRARLNEKPEVTGGVETVVAE